MTPTWAHGAFMRLLDVGHDGSVYTKEMGKCHESQHLKKKHLYLGVSVAAHHQASLQTPLSSLKLMVFLENSTRCHQMRREDLHDSREGLGQGFGFMCSKVDLIFTHLFTYETRFCVLG